MARSLLIAPHGAIGQSRRPARKGHAATVLCTRWRLASITSVTAAWRAQAFQAVFLSAAHPDAAGAASGLSRASADAYQRRELPAPALRRNGRPRRAFQRVDAAALGLDSGRDGFVTPEHLRTVDGAWRTVYRAECHERLPLTERSAEAADQPARETPQRFWI